MSINQSSQSEVKQVTVPFNVPYLTGREEYYIKEVLNSRKLSGNGAYTDRCHKFFIENYNFKSCFLATSCTDALEMAALLIDLKPGDEVIMPSYTFVSSANPFILRGAKVIFIDSRADHPGMDEDKIEEVITPNTKAIVAVHYAGVACDMDNIMAIADKHGIDVIEDAAQAIDSYYKGRPLGSIGHLGAMSFHETKNISSGEGGLLIVNDEKYIERAEIIREKGTDRSKFLRGEVNKYGWVEVGSSFLPSELIAGFLLAQLDELKDIQSKRVAIWHRYYTALKSLADKGYFKLPVVPDYATVNGHLFGLIMPSEADQNNLRNHLKANKVYAVFHYNPLHRSKYYKNQHDGRVLEQCDNYDACLLRLPLFADMTEEQQTAVIEQIKAYYS